MRMVIPVFILCLTLASFAQEREIVADCKLNSREFTVIVTKTTVELHDTTLQIRYTFPAEMSGTDAEGVESYKMANDTTNFVSLDEENWSGYLHAVTPNGQRVSGNLTCSF